MTRDEGRDVPYHPLIADAQEAGPAVVESRARRAVIYVPGLEVGFTRGKTARGVVTRLATACDASANRRAARFDVRWYDEALRDAPTTARIATIDRREAAGGEARPVVDVFTHRWSDDFVERWRGRNLFVRALQVALSLLKLPAFLRFFRSAGRTTPKARAQLVLALSFSVVMVGYAGLVVYAVYQTADDWFEDGGTPTAPAAEETTTSTAAAAPASGPDPTTAAAVDGEGTPDDGNRTTIPQRLALIGAAVAGLAPNVRRRLDEAGGALFTATSYLKVADGKPEIIEGLRTLVEELAEDSYHHVAIVAYSFGSIVAIDALYPTTGPAEETFRTVDALVTIGSPFDFVMALRPRWTDGRQSLAGVPGSWLNVYSPTDLLGSSFRDDKSDADATIPVASGDGGAVVKPTANHAWDLGALTVSVLDYVHLYGFASHGLYWGRDDVKDRNVFVPVVKHLYDAAPDVLG